MDVPAFSFVESDILLLLNFLRFASLWKEQRLKQFRTICIFDICQSSACSLPLRSFIIIFMERDLSDSQNSPQKGRRKTFGLLHKMINVFFSSKCNSKTNLSPQKTGYFDMLSPQSWLNTQSIFSCREEKIAHQKSHKNANFDLKELMFMIFLLSFI